MGNQDHTEEEERRIREVGLDETLAATFPASDPPSTIPNPVGDDTVEPGVDTDEEKEKTS